MDSVVSSRSKTNLLGYVHSLVYSLDVNKGTKYPMQNIRQDSEEYLSALHNLHSLSFYNIATKPIDEGGFRACFSGFRETLTKFSLERVASSFSMFVTLVGYFPNINNLRLGSFKLTPDEWLVPSLSRPLRGRLCIHDIGSDGRKFIDRLAGLDLEYSGLVIEAGDTVRVQVIRSMLQLSASTIRYLRLDAALGEHPSMHSIAHTPLPNLLPPRPGFPDHQSFSTTPRA